MEERKFRVVLSKIKLGDGSGRRLIPATQMASGWLFLSFPVEHGSWWIPVVEEGKLSIQAVAMHSREFSEVLLKIVKAMMTGMPRESAADSGRLEKSKFAHADCESLPYNNQEKRYAVIHSRGRNLANIERPQAGVETYFCLDVSDSTLDE